MTIEGTINRTGILLLCVLATAFFTWNQFFTTRDPAVVMPYILVGAFGGFIMASDAPRYVATIMLPHEFQILDPETRARRLASIDLASSSRTVPASSGTPGRRMGRKVEARKFDTVHGPRGGSPLIEAANTGTAGDGHGVLGRQQLRKLKIYAGPEHPHQAQQPAPMEVDV